MDRLWRTFESFYTEAIGRFAFASLLLNDRQLYLARNSLLSLSTQERLRVQGTPKRSSAPLGIDMNLTSLLNIGTTAVEQQKKMESSCNTLIRNRTPWDAGGYSLPINTISRASHSISPQQIQSDVSRKLENQTPISPTPRFSNSRSDRSSFASFLPSSTTHSRYSSISTVNSTYHLNNFAPDKISPKLTNVPHALELPAIDSQSDTRLSTSISPTGSLDSLALVAENHLFSQLPNQQSSDRVTAENLNGRGSDESLSQLIPCHRPSSPSDAILIKRSTIPILKVDTRDRDRDSEKEDLPRS